MTLIRGVDAGQTIAIFAVHFQGCKQVIGCPDWDEHVLFPQVTKAAYVELMEVKRTPEGMQEEENIACDYVVIILLSFDCILTKTIMGATTCFLAPCHAEGTHREHVQLVEFKAPDVPHGDGTPEHVKQLKNTQSEVIYFDWLYFVAQVRRGELNGTVPVNYQVVGRINRYNLCAPEDCYETFPEEIHSF